MADDPTTPPTPAGDPAGGATPPAPEATQEDGPADLGDPGKRALTAEREARKAAEKAAKEAQDELDAIKAANLTDTEKAIKDAGDQARADTLAEVNTRLFAAEVRATSAGKLADPDLLADPDVAMRLLGFAEIPLASDGNIDQSAVASAVDELIVAKPYLTGGPATIDLGQGARGGPPTGPVDPLLETVQKIAGIR